VHAFQVTGKMTMREYSALGINRPDISSLDIGHRLGDNYLFFDPLSRDIFALPSVHRLPEFWKNDLSGRNTLVSGNFFYFGHNAPRVDVAVFEVAFPTPKQCRGQKRTSVAFDAAMMDILRRYDDPTVARARFYGHPVPLAP
jgi:hypothetical protein